MALSIDSSWTWLNGLLSNTKMTSYFKEVKQRLKQDPKSDRLPAPARIKEYCGNFDRYYKMEKGTAWKWLWDLFFFPLVIDTGVKGIDVEDEQFQDWITFHRAGAIAVMKEKCLRNNGWNKEETTSGEQVD